MPIIHQKTPARKRAVRLRAEHPDSFYRYCTVFPCRRPTRAGTNDGLDRRLCRHHADRLKRHGDVTKPSYTEPELRKHRYRVSRWLQSHADDRWVLNARQRIIGLYERAGEATPANSLRGLTPRQRADAVWARMRQREVDPMKPIAAWLAVELAIVNDPQPSNQPDFKRVQAAKLVHRLASGTHRRWERERKVWVQNLGYHKSIVEVVTIDAYSKPIGRMIRHLGSDLEKACDVVADLFRREIILTTKERKP